MRAIAPASALGALVLLTVSRCVFAQSEPPRTPALEAATERFEVGKRLFREGKREQNPSKIERAFFEFEAAYAIYPGRGTLLNLVEAELATGRVLEAMKHVRAYARTYGVPELRSEYGQTFQAQRELAFRSTGHVEIDAPPAMRVVLDGKDAAVATPLTDPLDVMPGHHVVELVGGETLRGETDAAAGAITRLAFAVTQPSPRTALAPGAAASGESVPLQVVVARSEDGALPPAPSFWTASRSWGVVAGVAGLVSLGTGIVFAVRANEDADRASTLAATLGASGCVVAQPQPCRDLQSAHDDQSRDHALNLVLVSVGAAAVVSGAALLLWPTRSPYRTALVPAVSMHGAGLELRGEL